MYHWLEITIRVAITRLVMNYIIFFIIIYVLENMIRCHVVSSIYLNLNLMRSWVVQQIYYFITISSLFLTSGVLFNIISMVNILFCPFQEAWSLLESSRIGGEQPRPRSVVLGGEQNSAEGHDHDCV